MKHKTLLKNFASELTQFLLTLKQNKQEIVLLSPDEINHPHVLSAGITHQNIIGVAAGLSLEGKHPIIITNASFCPSMNYSQLNHSICKNELALTIIALGKSEDGAILRNLPITFVSPSSVKEAQRHIITSATSRKASYILWPEETKEIHVQAQPGKAAIIRTGEDVTIVTTGTLAHAVLITAQKLERQEIRCEIIHAPTVHPIDKHLIISSAAKTRCVAIVEQNEGLAGAAEETLAEHSPVPVEKTAVNPDEHAITNAVKRALLRKSENVCTTVPESHGYVPLTPNLHFNVHKGGVIKSIPGLHQAMLSMEQEVFNHHVNDQKNDFATWVREAAKDELLAQKLFSLKTKTGMTATLATWLSR